MSTEAAQGSQPTLQVIVRPSHKHPSSRLVTVPLNSNQSTGAETVVRAIGEQLEEKVVRLWADKLMLQPADIVERRFGTRIYSAEAFDQSPEDSVPWTVFVRTLSDSVMRLECPSGPLTTVLELAELVHGHMDAPPDQQRLIYLGVQMQSERTLKHYRVFNGALIHLVLRLRGGGSGFEFNSIKVKEVRGWSHNAPKWRWVRAGLCIEGVCNNETCVASGKSVICSKGMCRFDVQLDARNVYCPCCNKPFKPETCAFNNCTYWVVGQTVDSDQLVRLPPTVAGDAYTRYSETGGKVVWKHLVLEAREDAALYHQANVDPDKECAICLAQLTLQSMQSKPPHDVTDSTEAPDHTRSSSWTVTMDTCKHSFHRSCADGWVATMHTCPYCSVPG